MMDRDAVLVVDDDALGERQIAHWLGAQDVFPYLSSETSLATLSGRKAPRIVICKPGSSGVAVFHWMQSLKDQPIVLILSDEPAQPGKVQGDGKSLTAVMHAPVDGAGLSRLVKLLLDVSTRITQAPAETAPQLNRPRHVSLNDMPPAGRA
jgi:DNA-binding response OmpR family regulator